MEIHYIFVAVVFCTSCSEVTARNSQPILAPCLDEAEFENACPKLADAFSLKCKPKTAYFRVDVLQRHCNLEANILGTKRDADKGKDFL